MIIITMKNAKIYHVTDPEFVSLARQPRELVATIEASDLEDAYVKTQNLKEYWNKENPCRSTSIGDVIEIDDKYYMVKSIGFEDITNTLKTNIL
jgi:hypothetical protein